MRLALAIVNKTDNGYVVKYPEAVQVEHRVMSPVGLDDAHIEIAARLNVLSREGPSEEPWDAERRERQVEAARQALREIRDKFAATTQKAWAIKISEWHFPTFDGIVKALKEADRAHEQLLTLLRAGTHFVGALQPAALMVGGGQPMF